MAVLSTAETLAGSFDWALQYQGPKNNDLLYDKRVVQLIAADLGNDIRGAELSAFQGTPDAGGVVEGRYVWAAGCEPRQCEFNRGLFWIDSVTGESLAAHAKTTAIREGNDPVLKWQTVLTLGGSAGVLDAVPVHARIALRDWLRASDTHPTLVRYRSSSDAKDAPMKTVDAADYLDPGHRAPQ